jgi:hypothetical protein
MTQPTPQFPIGYGTQRLTARTSAAAITSFVLGLVGCIPYLTGIAAVVLGFLAIRKSRDPSVTGKGLAIAGIVLGTINVLGWSGFAAFLGYGYVESKPAEAVATQFLTDVSNGNTQGAMAKSGATAAQIQKYHTEFVPLGTLRSVSYTGFNVSSWNGHLVMRVSGTATFSTGQKACTFSLVKTSGGYKVTHFLVQ